MIDGILDVRYSGRTAALVQLLAIKFGPIPQSALDAVHAAPREQLETWTACVLTAPVEEIMQALDDIVRAGKARYIGASSMFAWQFAKAQYTSDLHGWTRFVSMQNHYNLLYREEEREMIPLCLDQGVGVLPWSPLARGRLARGRPTSSGTDTPRGRHDEFSDQFYVDIEPAIIDHLHDVADAHGLPPARIALAWLLSKPAVTAPIVGATSPRHIDDAIAALEVNLDDEEVAALEQPYRAQGIRGHT